MGTGEDLSTGTPPYEKCPIFRKVGRFGLKLGKISNYCEKCPIFRKNVRFLEKLTVQTFLLKKRKKVKRKIFLASLGRGLILFDNTYALQHEYTFANIFGENLFL